MATPVSSTEKIAAIVVGGGSGSRFGGDIPKQFCLLGGKWVFDWSLERFEANPAVQYIVAVVAPEYVESARQRWQSRFPKLLSVIAGGASRFESVANGLHALPSDTGCILIHDAARPGVDDAIINDVIAATIVYGAALPIESIPSTVKHISDGTVAGTLNRSQLGLAQTPQGFQRAILDQGIAAAGKDVIHATDEIQLVEKLVKVHAVAGSEWNRKITTPVDFFIVEHLLLGKDTNTMQTTGIGYDIHRFQAGRALILGGVKFDSELGLLGHSDADVLCHAIMDAILGACGLGDIGVHFPDTDPAWKDASSLELLKEVMRKSRSAGFEVVSIDVTLIMEAPKVMKRSADMIANLRNALGSDDCIINVKATTNERVGGIGNGEAAAAIAVATMRRTNG